MLSGKVRLCVLLVIMGIIGISMIGVGSQCPWTRMKEDDTVDFTTGSSAGALTTTSARLIRVLDSDGNTGQYPAIAVDLNNKAHVTYYDVTYGDLKYITNASGNWETPVRVDGQDGTNKGQYTSIAMDTSNKAHISYYDATNGDLKYATNASGAWVKTPIDYDNDVGQHTDIAVLEGVVYISYYDVTNSALKCITGTTGAWDAMMLDNSADVGLYTSIAVVTGTGQAIIHISYYDATNHDLKYITNFPNGGNEWISALVVDEDDDVGLYSSIAVTTANIAHISYYDATNGSLKYARITDGSSVISTTVDTTGDVGKYTSIGVASAIHISYYDATNGDLKYATNANGTWEIIAMDSDWDVGLYTSLAMDDNGQIHISYYDNSYWDLKYTTILLPPQDPSDLVASELGPTSAVLSWVDNANNEDGFEIERKAEGGTWKVIARVGVNAETYSDSGLWPQTTYYYRLRAFNSTVYSFYSSPISLTTAGPPNAPTECTIVADSIAPSALSITWTDNSSNEDGFKIERHVAGGFYSTIATVGPDTTLYADSGLLPNTQYYYRVRAYSGSINSAYSNEANGTTDPKPNAPSNLSQVYVEPSRVAITWTDNAGNEDGFKIERKVGAGWSLIKKLDQPSGGTGGVVNYLDQGLSANTTYYYRVKSYSGTADSDASNTLNATTSFPPGAPSGLIASAIAGKQINLSWTDGSTNEDGFRIERRAGGGSWVIIGTVGTDVKYYEDKNLNPGTVYTYCIWSFNGSVTSTTASNEAAATAQP